MPGCGLGPPKGVGLNPGPPGCLGAGPRGPAEPDRGPDAELGRDKLGFEGGPPPAAGLGAGGAC